MFGWALQSDSEHLEQRKDFKLIGRIVFRFIADIPVSIKYKKDWIEVEIGTDIYRIEINNYTLRLQLLRVISKYSSTNYENLEALRELAYLEQSLRESKGHNSSEEIILEKYLIDGKSICTERVGVDSYRIVVDKKSYIILGSIGKYIQEQFRIIQTNSLGLSESSPTKYALDLLLKSLETHGILETES